MDPRLSREHDAGRPAAEPGQAARQPAASARWARASRRRARSPGPTSSTAPGPARTASSTSSTATRTSSARRSTPPPRRCPARGAGRSATTGPARLLAVQPQAAATVLRRQGTPFWDYLDAAGVPSTFYDLPSNYPPSPSQHGHHRCICGMGTPDMLGTYGTYQHFAEDGPTERRRRGRQAVRADVRERPGRRRHRRAANTAAQEAGADRESISSSTATARPTRR